MSKHWCSLLIAAAALCASMCAQEQAVCRPSQAIAARLKTRPDAATYAALGIQFGQAHRYACAAQALQSAQRLDPKSPRILYLEALNLDLSGRPGDAVQELNRAIELAPASSPNYLLLGSIEAELKQPGEARQHWQKALELDPQSVPALDLLSRSYIGDGDFASAVRLLQSASATVETSEDLTLDLALAFAKEGKLEQASGILAHALKTHPGSQRFIAAQVTVLVQQTHFQEAETLAHTFAAAHPRDLPAQYLYLNTLVLNKNNTLAMPLAARLLAASPHDPQVLYLNGILERDRENLPLARRHLEESVQLDPSNASAHAQLGLVLAGLHDDAAAKPQFEQALALGNQDVSIRFAFATTLRNLGQTAEAQQQLKIYQQQLQASAAAKLADTKAAQADQELAAKHPANAAALYREAIEAAPDDALLAYKLSVALDRMGDLAAEQTALEQAVRLDPSLAIAQNQLGFLASQRGDPAAAEKCFRLAVQASPGYMDAWISLAATLGMEHRLPEARDAIASALKLDPKNADALSLRDALDAAGQTP